MISGYQTLTAAVAALLLVAVMMAVDGNWMAFWLALSNAQAAYGWRYALTQPAKRKMS